MLNDDILKNGKPFGKDNSDELPERIREIRASELMAEDEVLMSMQDWVDQTNQFLSNNRRKVLEGKGRISHEQAIEKAAKEYDIFRVRQNQEYVSEFDKQTEKYFKGE